MFQDLLEGLNENGAGVRAFETCARNARARIASEPHNAAALLLISYAAHLFVESYYDQPLTIEVANEENARFAAMVGKLDAASASGSPDKMLAALNEVAAEIGEGLSS